MTDELWDRCLKVLEAELSSQQFNTWIRPLQAIEEGQDLKLLAPNQFVRDFIVKEMLDEVQKLANSFSATPLDLKIEVGSETQSSAAHPSDSLKGQPKNDKVGLSPLRFEGRLNPAFTFDTHIGGKSNQLARAASRQVGENPGSAYNPLFLYGGVGLGKTHLMQAAGNLVMASQAKAKVVYVLICLSGRQGPKLTSKKNPHPSTSTNETCSNRSWESQRTKGKFSHRSHVVALNVP